MWRDENKPAIFFRFHGDRVCENAKQGVSRCRVSDFQNTPLLVGKCFLVGNQFWMLKRSDLFEVECFEKCAAAASVSAELSTTKSAGGSP